MFERANRLVRPSTSIRSPIPSLIECNQVPLPHTSFNCMILRHFPRQLPFHISNSGYQSHECPSSLAISGSQVACGSKSQSRSQSVPLPGFNQCRSLTVDCPRQCQSVGSNIERMCGSPIKLTLNPNNQPDWQFPDGCSPNYDECVDERRPSPQLWWGHTVPSNMNAAPFSWLRQLRTHDFHQLTLFSTSMMPTSRTSLLQPPHSCDPFSACPNV